jgi:hypothetical protein
MSANIIIEGPNGQSIRVNPARDVANYWGQLLSRAVELLHDHTTWPAPLRPYLEAEGVTPAEMVECGLAIRDACLSALRRGNDSPYDALTAAGFLSHRPIVQAAVVLRIGQVSLGAWWEGIRDSTIEGVVPACHEDLVRAGLLLAEYLNGVAAKNSQPP